MSHIFVSYGRADRAYVDRLIGWLARADVEAWYDRDIPTGQRWRNELQGRIGTCSALMLVMTPSAARSRWVAREVAYARRLGKPVLPLLREGKILFRLNDIQFEDVRDGGMPSPEFVARLHGLAPTRHVLRHQIGLVPGEADTYQHREVADDIDAALTADGAVVLTGQASAPPILSGLGGVGKTQLAASVARRMRGDGELDLLLWVGARSRESILTTYARAAAKVIGSDPRDAEQAATELLAHLATTAQRWLIVLDDLADPNDLIGLWPPLTATGRAIVTTRRRDAALAGRGRVMTVDVFTDSEATNYLAAKFRGHPHRLVEARELADDLGRLPIALAQAAAYVADQGITCADYRRLFAAHPLAALAPEAWPDEYARSVTVTLSLSIEAADRFDPVGRAKPLLTVLSLLDPGGVPDDLVVSSPVVEYVTGQADESAQVSAALTSLTTLNLATVATAGSHGGEKSHIRVHALVQRAMRDQTPSDDLGRAGGAAADGLRQIWPDIEREASLGQLLRSNTTALQAVVEDQLWEADRHELLYRAGRSLGDAGLVTAATEYFRELASNASRRLGPDHPDTLSIRGGLARWQGTAGDPAGAAAISEALLADLVRVLGPDHVDTLAVRASIARWQGESGDPRAAAAASEALLADMERALGPDHPHTLSTRGNLAFWLGEVGEATRALDALQAVLADTVRQLGPDHPTTLATRHNIAFRRGDAGDAAGAASSLEAVLAEHIRILGPDHPETLAVRANLAHWQGEAGDPAKAVSALTAVLADQERLLGPDHPDTALTRRNVARWREAASTGPRPELKAQHVPANER